ALPSALQRSRSRFHCRNAPKQLTRNTIAKKQTGQEDTDSDYLFGDCSQRAVFRFGCGKSSVIKQTLEMQSEDTSATRDPLKEACLARGVWVNSCSKAPARLTALAKRCSLLGRDSGFSGSRVEETEARMNRKYRNSRRSL